MKKTTGYITAFVLVVAFSSMVIFKPKKVIFFGDSITANAVKPGGFVVLLQDMLKQKGVDNNYELVGAGIPGNKIYDLYFRLEHDVLSKQPDEVIIYIGVNDVWHKTLSGTGTDAGRFENFYGSIIQKIQATGAQVILCTPAVIGEKKGYMNPQDGDLNAYSQIIRDLAEKYGCSLVDLRRLFIDYETDNNPDNKESGILTRDKVHLTDAGNKLVADQLYPLITK